MNSFGHAADLAWKADALYKVGHFVVRSGVAYFALADNQNSQPPTANWREAAEHAWLSGYSYKIGDLATYSGGLYICIQATASELPTNAAYWTAVGGGGPGGGTTIYSGKAAVSFGAWPGGWEASTIITGQTAILATSRLAAWVDLLATGDHSADEHLAEEGLLIRAGNIVPGTGFTLYARSSPSLQEPLQPWGGDRLRLNAVPAAGQPLGSVGGLGLRLYGSWNVVWQYWN